MNVLMIGVDETSIGGMLTVVNNYKNNKEFCKMTNLKYVATVIRSNKLVKIKTFLCKIPEIISTIRNDKIDIVHVHMAERGSVFRGICCSIGKCHGMQNCYSYAWSRYRRLV